MRTIVVGTDGSEHATVAMRWAADEAEIHGAALEVMLVWSFLDQYHADRTDTFYSGYTEESARGALDSWVREAFGAEAPVTQRVVNDLPARALLEASDAADLLVLGARGRGGFEGLLFGSVSERVAQLATRPVAVVRAAAAVRGARVVVGVDGSARSLGALRWAAAEARARDAELDVVYAWRLPAMAAAPVMAAFPDYPSLEEAGHAILDAAVAEPTLADTRVRPHFVRDSPTREPWSRVPQTQGSSWSVPAAAGESPAQCWDR